MDTKFNTLNGCRNEVVVTLTPNDLEPHYKRAYKDAQPELEVKGFRKGKVPLDVVKKRFGKRIRANAIGDITGEVFQNIVRTNEIKTIGRPVLSNVDEHGDGTVQFTIEYDVQPDFELGEYKNVPVERRSLNITDEVLDREIDRLLLDHGKPNEAEQVAGDNFFVMVEAQQIDPETGVPAADAPKEELRWFLANRDIDPEIKAKTLNLKVGDTFEHQYPGEGNADVMINFLHTMREIQEVVPAEFTNDFVESISQGRYTSTEELRKQIETEMRQAMLEHTDKSVGDQIIRNILERHQGWDVPQALVEELNQGALAEFKENQPNKELPAGFDVKTFFERVQPQSQRSARWLLVRDAIIEKEGLKADEADIDAFTEKIAAGANLDPAQIRPIVTQDERFMAQIINDKAMELLREHADYTDVSVERPEDVYVSGAENTKDDSAGDTE